MNQTMSTQLLRGAYLPQRHAYVAEQEPAVLHCHHYNCYLQAVLLDTRDYLPRVEQLLIDSAQEVAYAQFKNYFDTHAHLGELDKMQVIEDYFRFAGFGKISLANTNELGGTIESTSDHYGLGWKYKFGPSKQPVSYFTCGFLTGALEAIHGLKCGMLSGHQTSCLAMGDPFSRFVINISSTHRNLAPSPQEGEYQTYQLHPPQGIPVDYLGIIEALTHMPLEGQEQSGLIEAFDVMLTRHYANYYCNISYGFLEEFRNEVGEENHTIAIELLTEAGHVCAFNTFGGIMQSSEWNALIRPSLKTPEDWVHGMVAAVNAFGWGFWEIVELLPNEKLVVKIHSGYEANAYLKKFGSSNVPISFLATGGVTGLMNLIYTLNLPERTPLSLDEEVYKQIHLTPQMFVGRQVHCRAMGDTYDLIEVVKR